LGMMKLS